mmetsp:Transcript_30006/g.97697  ORF Transcript_30006/g.97697 Transcript_30006/m.97697 type:complete len:280 (-) Transcript_30006:388-1227(-)
MSTGCVYMLRNSTERCTWLGLDRSPTSALGSGCASEPSGLRFSFGLFTSGSTSSRSSSSSSSATPPALSSLLVLLPSSLLLPPSPRFRRPLALMSCRDTRITSRTFSARISLRSSASDGTVRFVCVSAFSCPPTRASPPTSSSSSSSTSSYSSSSSALAAAMPVLTSGGSVITRTPVFNSGSVGRIVHPGMSHAMSSSASSRMRRSTGYASGWSSGQIAARAGLSQSTKRRPTPASVHKSSWLALIADSSVSAAAHDKGPPALLVNCASHDPSLRSVAK